MTGLASSTARAFLSLGRRPTAPRLRLSDGVEAEVEFYPRSGVRRYVLRVTPEGTVRVTMPRWGSKRFALRFAEGQAAWIAVELGRRRAAGEAWRAGGRILFRGEWAVLEVEETAGGRAVAWAGERVILSPGAPADLRAALLPALRRLARRDLAPRLAAGAERMGVRPGPLSIRDQRSRWGSCAASGAISLNWRLIQMPDWVAESVVLHELAHLREPNHSPRFWAVVDAFDPRRREADAWLAAHRVHLF